MNRVAHRFRGESEVFVKCTDCEHIVPLEEMAKRGPVHLEGGQPHFEYSGKSWNVTIQQWDQCCKPCRKKRDDTRKAVA